MQQLSKLLHQQGAQEAAQSWVQHSPDFQELLNAWPAAEVQPMSMSMCLLLSVCRAVRIAWMLAALASLYEVSLECQLPG